MKQTTVMAVVTMFGTLMPAWAGTVSGTIQGADGKSVGVVTVYLQGQMTSGVMAHGMEGKTSKDGSFTLNGVQKGTYRVCVPGGADGYVDPCIWSTSPPSVTLKADDSTESANVVIPRAATVAVQVSDDQGYLAAHEKNKTPRLPMMIGVRAANGLFVPMSIASGSEKARRYTASIPVGSQVGVLVQCEDYGIVEDGVAAEFAVQGKALLTKVQSDTAGAVKELKIRVTGKR